MNDSDDLSFAHRDTHQQSWNIRQNSSSSSHTQIIAATTNLSAVSRRSITEGGGIEKPASESPPTAPNRTLVASISAGGSEGQLCRSYGEEHRHHLVEEEEEEEAKTTVPKVRCHCQLPPAHYGSTSTTFSTGSSNLTTSSFDGATGTIHLQPDQSSVASSSGVATMSSTDHLPMICGTTGSLTSAHSPPLSRSSADDSTPTMSTLTGGASMLRRELEPLLSSAASTLASSGSVLTAAGGAATTTAFASLSLSTPASTSSLCTTGLMASAIAPPRLPIVDGGLSSHSACKAMTDGSKFGTVGLLLSAHSQAQSTPTLFGGVDNASNDGLTWNPGGASVSSTSCNGSMGCGEKVQRQNCGSGRRHDEENTAERQQHQSTATVTNAGMTMGSVAMTDTYSQATSQAMPSTSSTGLQQLSLLGPSPLPSIICTPLRTIVSQNRRRYQMDGFNLDLTYITDRIIAMGYPADTREALYRNSMSHIVKFLEHYHGNHYKVFNLRGQYVYDPANFHNRVVSFEMTDHHPPRLELMAPFCREVHDYLDADPQNVVAVHCKAGKGRTGVMICAYLCYISFYRTPRQNMDYYSIIRTHNNKGVTIPSQRRYVYYFSHLRERKLNYMPLRCELVGVYLERPPKLSGPFSKGALKVRVAVGDVDVFLGDELWVNGEKYEEEEELRKRYPSMAGDDQYDPLKSDDARKICISRRCFGWTVPENRRVFLEGDVRVDIFQTSQLKLFNVKQEKKKIGHIWFNTMFTCPGFCGGAYMHGDEAYPYPQSMIVRRHYKRKQQLRCEDNQRLKDVHPASAPSIVGQQGQQEQFQNGDSGSEKETSHGGQEPSRHGPSRVEGKRTRREEAALARKTRSTRSPCHQLIEAEARSWQSQDGGDRLSQKQQHLSGGRSSLDNTAMSSEVEEWEDEIVVERPPGLDAHCSDESLKRIFPNCKQAPRHGIEEMIREAFHKNLINDLYNTRRVSQPCKENLPIPKAPVGRPNANGPNCLVRKSDEHVSVFGVQEIDRAYKNKDIDPGFKVFIITRCIDEGNTKDVELAEQHLAATRQKQMQKDQEKSEKMEQKQRKHMATAQPQQQQQSQLNMGFIEADSSQGDQQQAACSLSTDSSCTSSATSHSQQSGSEASAHQSSMPLQTLEDPRLSDPHLKKYFFRQRVTSKSRHPHVHHHCSLRVPDSRICAKYGCDGHAYGEVNNPMQQQQQRRRSSANERRYCPKMEEAEEMLEADEEELEAEEEDDASFDDFDFFHPRQPTCSTLRDDVVVEEGMKGAASIEPSLTTTQTQLATSSKTCCHGSEQIISGKQPTRTTKNRSSFNRETQDPTTSSTGAASTSLSPEMNEPEIFHPSDCSLFPSSSSSCSSTDSLEQRQPPLQQPEQATDTTTQTSSSQHHHPHHRHHHRHHSHRSGNSASSGERK